MLTEPSARITHPVTATIFAIVLAFIALVADTVRMASHLSPQPLVRDASSELAGKAQSRSETESCVQIQPPQPFKINNLR